MRVVALVELDCMDVLKVGIWHSLYSKIFVHIVNYHIFVRTADDTDMALNFGVVKREGWYMLGIWMLKLLNQFV